MSHASCLTVLLLGLSVAIVPGCSGAPSADDESSPPDAAYLMTSEPAGAVGVGDARTAAADREPVTIVGRIGGRSKPFVDGIAAFTLVDPDVAWCVEDGCPTPWDYCCEQDQVRGKSALVKVVDASGKPVERDARRLLGVKELSLVVVSGTARRDAQGNLTILANRVHVKSQP